MATGPAAQEAARKKGQQAGKGQLDKGPGSVSGNLTRDPELRYTDDGIPVANFGLAYSERVFDRQADKWTDGETEFYEVQAWRTLAENAVNCLGKGDRVVAEGRWTELAWTDKEGQQRTRVVLTARDMGPSLLYRGARLEPKPESRS